MLPRVHAIVDMYIRHTCFALFVLCLHVVQVAAARHFKQKGACTIFIFRCSTSQPSVSLLHYHSLITLQYTVNAGKLSGSRRGTVEFDELKDILTDLGIKNDLDSPRIPLHRKTTPSKVALPLM